MIKGRIILWPDPKDYKSVKAFVIIGRTKYGYEARLRILEDSTSYKAKQFVDLNTYIQLMYWFENSNLDCISFFSIKRFNAIENAVFETEKQNRNKSPRSQNHTSGHKQAKPIKRFSPKTGAARVNLPKRNGSSPNYRQL